MLRINFTSLSSVQNWRQNLYSLLLLLFVRGDLTFKRNAIAARVFGTTVALDLSVRRISRNRIYSERVRPCRTRSATSKIRRPNTAEMNVSVPSKSPLFIGRGPIAVAEFHKLYFYIICSARRSHFQISLILRWLRGGLAPHTCNLYIYNFCLFRTYFRTTPP